MAFKNEIFAVVDLETTGSSYKNGDRIIQIGMVFVKDNTIVQEYDFKVNPNKKIPILIENLTGISNKDVKNAPYFEDIAHYVYNLLEDCTFVAHNIDFDYRFLNKSFQEAGLPELTIRGIDTVELTKILFPTLDSYRLADLSNQFKFTHDKVHDAAGDARATAELFLFLQERALALPLVTLEALVQLSRHTQRNNQDFFEKVLEKARENKKPLPLDVGIVNGLALKIKAIENEQTGHRVKSSLTSHGLWEMISKKMHFKRRNGQMDMMTQIESFFSSPERQDFAIEAPAGFGKTLAYLIPAVLAATPENKVVISTSTLLLQEQLERALEELQESLPFSVASATLSSRRHLIDLAKVSQVNNTELFGSDALTMMSIIVWLTETQTGNLLELNTTHQMGALIEMLSYKYADQNSTAQWQEHDFYLFHQEKAKNASILLTNHSYLSHHFEELKVMTEGKMRLIVDEAHRLPSVYKEKEKTSFALSAIRRKVTKFSNVVRNYREHLEQHAKSPFPHYELINLEFAIDQLISSLNEMERHFEAQLSEEKETSKITDDGYYLTSDFLDSQWFKRFSRKIFSHYEDLILTGSRYVDLNGVNKENQFINRLDIFMLNLHAQMDHFKNFIDNDEYSYYAIKAGRKLGADRITLEKNYWRIGAKLQNNLHKTFSKALYVSATLFMQEETNYFSRKIGVDNLDTLSYTSKYEDLEKTVSIFVPTDTPVITKMGHYEWMNMLSEFIFTLVKKKEKKILVLFNSNQILEEVLNKLRSMSDTDRAGIEFLAQGYSGSQRRVHRRFLEAEHAVLLGSGSYWEGIDFPDQPVEILVMTRLPFDPPETPENRAIDHYYHTIGSGNAFHTESLPKMVMRFIQGMGRISREEGHSGILYCLDNRLLFSPYAHRIIKSLPEGVSIMGKKYDELIN